MLLIKAYVVIIKIEYIYHNSYMNNMEVLDHINVINKRFDITLNLDIPHFFAFISFLMNGQYTNCINNCIIMYPHYYAHFFREINIYHHASFIEFYRDLVFRDLLKKWFIYNDRQKWALCSDPLQYLQEYLIKKCTNYND
jgi:hypothetical protein